MIKLKEYFINLNELKTKEDILNAVVFGFNKKRTAYKLNLSVKALDRNLKFYDLKWKEIRVFSQKGKNNYNYKYIPKEEIIRLAKEGISQTKIAKFFEITIKTLTNRLKEYEINWKEISTYTRRKENNSFYGQHHTEKTKQIIGNKNRVRMVANRQNIYPRYSKKACEFFDWLNKNTNFKGQHAKNGKEFHIKELGYFVDYYDSDANIVMEYDEPYHFDSKGNLRERDIKRMKEIINHLNCGFIRLRNTINGRPEQYYIRAPEIRNEVGDIIEEEVIIDRCQQIKP